MGMKIGDKGFTVTELWNGELPLAILLNGVEKTREGDNFYLIGDFTFENLSDNYLEIERPDAARSEERRVGKECRSRGEKEQAKKKEEEEQAWRRVRTADTET